MISHFDPILPPIHHLLVLQPQEAWSASDIIALLTLGAIIWTAWETVKLRKASFQAYYGLLSMILRPKVKQISLASSTTTEREKVSTSASSLRTLARVVSR